jgi:hypothetical protein
MRQYQYLVENSYMQKHILLIILLTLSRFSLQAQDKAEYRQKFTEGSYLILEENYTQALKSFLGAYAIDSSNANINYKVGFCYLKTVTEKAKALPYLEKAVRKTTEKYTDMEPREESAPIHAYYYYGQALHLNYRFDEAIANFEKFKSFLRAKQKDLVEDVDRQIQMSNNAKSLVAAPVNVIIKNMGDSINTSFPEYSPVMSADEKTLIFTSRRQGSTGGDKTIEDQYYEDIYVSYRKSDSSWTTPVSISPNINSVTHEATVGLTADAQTLLIYKDGNGGDIYYSTLDGNNWSFPTGMGSDINSANWETSACLTPDGNTLYYVSNRPGGMGGRDIWKCVKLPNGKWSLSVNLGAPINTKYDEESPFIHPSGNVLFFSSKGHQSIGGFDIFFSSRGENGWDAPLNIGYPINTTDDDVFYVTSPDGKRGYYSSSSRAEGYGEKDLYVISIPERKEQPLVLIKGFIVPMDGQQLPPNLEIIATNNETGIIAGTYKPLMRDGSFTIIIPPGSNYNLSYTNDGQEFFNEVMEVPADAAYQEINREVKLKPVNFGNAQPVTDTVPKSNNTNTNTNTNANNNNTSSGNNTAANNSNNTNSNSGNEVAFISVTGKLLDEKNVPYTNLSVNLLDAQGNIVRTTTTDELGWFIFTELPQGEEYVVALSEDDTHFIGKKSSAEFKDHKGKTLKTKKIDGKYQHSKTSISFKNQKQTEPSTNNNTAGNNTSAGNNTAPADNGDKLNYSLNFGYNVTQIDVASSGFTEFIDKLYAAYQKNGSINVTLKASASTVPTRAFSSNKELAQARAEKAKEQILTALKAKGADESKIVFMKIQASVNGPAYNQDYQINRKMYEKYQYIKISAN